MHDDRILALARREAEGLRVMLEVRPAEGDGFVITRDGEHWRIVAHNARSCLWGVYHLLDGGREGTCQPRFTVRGLNVCETLSRHTSSQVASLIDRAARWRMNRLVVHDAYGYQRHAALINRMCAERGIEVVHYLQSTLLFLKGAPPELFALDEYGQPRTPHMGAETRLCPSNPKAREAFACGAAAYLGSDAVAPGSRLIVMDADGYLFCRCRACRTLTPVQQWERFFEHVQDAADATGKALSVHYLAYVWRYVPPTSARLLERLDGVMFDTHQRFRWRPLGHAHELTYYNRLEAQADPHAGTTPLNVYLKERLSTWRSTVAGEVYVFENLMLQGSISCPQPYTPQLLADLDTYEQRGVDGVVYEAYEPGIESFADQLGVLARAMWSDAAPYQPTDLERACGDLTEADCPDYHYKNCFNVLSYLTTKKFDGLALLRPHAADPLLQAYAARLKTFLGNRTYANLCDVLGYVIVHKERFDWMFITMNLARAATPPAHELVRDECARQVLACDKLYDYLEGEPDPARVMEHVVRSILQGTGASLTPQANHR